MHVEISPEDFLLAAEIARRLGVSVRTLRQLAKNGKIPPLTGPTRALKGWNTPMYHRWIVAGMPDAKTFRRIDPGY